MIGIMGIKAISVQSIEIEFGLTGTELGNSLRLEKKTSLMKILQKKYVGETNLCQAQSQSILIQSQLIGLR